MCLPAFLRLSASDAGATLLSYALLRVRRHRRRRRRFTGHRDRSSPSLEHPPPSPLLLPLGGSRDGRVNGEERTSVCPPLHDQPCLG